MERRVDTVRKHWDAYYKNIADCLLGRESLAVTAEQAREVVRVLEAATQSTEEHTTIHGLWGNS
jgi:scyllo-inositol 2-dehydrogenase (NADP+)